MTESDSNFHYEHEIVNDDQVQHMRQVEAAIKRARASGYRNIAEVARYTEGADLKTCVVPLLKQEAAPILYGTSYPPGAGRLAVEARRKTILLANNLPAPDPMRSQWWFTTGTVLRLAERIWRLSAGQAVAFLGAPTLGFHYAHRFGTAATILDIDSDVIDALKVVGVPTSCEAIVYDVEDEIPSERARRHSVVMLDPPWYLENILIFIRRACDLLVSNGFILCIVPQRLTRPGVTLERNDLLCKLLESGFEILAFESEAAEYIVPEFEAHAFKDIDGFDGTPWRRGDLLVLGTSDSSRLKGSISSPKDPKVLSYKRDPRKLRVFQRVNSHKSDLRGWLEPVREFESGVSTRGVPVEQVSIWTTSKLGVQVRDADLAARVLKAWENLRSEKQVVWDLQTESRWASESIEIVSAFKNGLKLWEEDSLPKHRRTPAKLRAKLRKYRSGFAAQPSTRDHPFEEDGFRLEFQRDRDRILWSSAIKSLANKSQLFPVASDDHLRRRLTHSIEVMQLASTIATSFGLDRDLTEAGALAHDIGHAPFGHAGEHAMNSLLNDIDPKFNGFNHYEHGVDVVRWVEDVYSSYATEGIPGLNLTPETIECIMKHTNIRDASHPNGQTNLIGRTKHGDILNDDLCHLEGQAVRIADKISYLMSDLEDGIRMGIFRLDDLNKCRLFLQSPIDFAPSTEEELLDTFISQRRSILKVIMEDVLESTEKRMASLNNLSEVRSSRDYTVDFSPHLKAQILEVWTQLIRDVLHKNRHVGTANVEAARIVTGLLSFFIFHPDLVEERFRKSHRLLIDTKYGEHYRKAVGMQVGVPKRHVLEFRHERSFDRKAREQGDNMLVETMDVVLAKDYVASLTDTRARIEYRKLIGLTGNGQSWP